ncbi:mycofactocin biosynthesis peptidyl-dipeptidase MftE [Saccharopolyspora cebuensis]|uniref:Mycofactocin biosynthesis peptidyl-dipeptidase MftE n=1 Tax=Saccharopolyspora cebuensis TaxID=418759 RepID=A0ABV4CIR9_9PSEU
MTRLSDLTWPEVGAMAGRSALLVPVGATEQHGPHLPCTVDTDIAVALCERVAASRADVVLAPPVAYGSSGEHAGFPGTLSLGQAATELLLVELVRSADSFAGVVLVSAHGGNRAPVRRAVSRLRAEGRRVAAWEPSGPADDSHAGFTETAVLLALRAGAVRADLVAAGNTAPLPELIDRLRARGVRAVSPGGVLGDPRGATADDGERLLAAWSAELAAAVDGVR